MKNSRFNVVEHLFSRYCLDTRLVAAHSDHVTDLYVASGSELKLHDSAGPCLIYLNSGIVMSTVNVVGGTTYRHPVLAFNSGMWLGAKSVAERYLQLEESIDLDFQALTDSGLVVFNGVLVEKLMQSQPDFRDFVMKICVNEAVRYAQMMIFVKYGGPVHRVVYGLALLAEAFLRNGGALSARYVTSHAPDMPISLTQSMVADLCGVSRSAASPILSQLQSKGWVELSYGQITLRRTLVWCRFAHSVKDGKKIHKSMSLEEILDAMSVCAQTLGEVDVGVSTKLSVALVESESP